MKYKSQIKLLQVIKNPTNFALKITKKNDSYYVQNKLRKIINM